MMSYHAKKTITSIISSFIILVSYGVSVYNEYSAGLLSENDAQYWAQKMLIFIGIGIVVTIVLHIIFHIFLSISISIQNRDIDDKTINHKLELEMVEDEMNKLIELKSLRVGYIVTGIGFIIYLGSLAYGISLFLGLNLLFLSFFLGSLAEGITTLFFYFRGLRNA